jgi:hypothetical protein
MSAGYRDRMMTLGNLFCGGSMSRCTSMSHREGN